MAFQLTQCPRCESTFNTNPRILEMAAGKVRCGACLNVFLAEDNFLSQPELDIDDAEQESVFIGNEPGEFFDPSVFISRTALKSEISDTAATQIEAPTSAEPIQDLEQPDAAPGSQQTVFELPDPPPPEPEPEEDAFSAPIMNPETAVAEDETSTVETDEHQEFFAAIDSSLEQYAESDDITDLEEIAAMEPLIHRGISNQPEPEPPNSAAQDTASTDHAQRGSWSENTRLSASFTLDHSRAEATPPGTAPEDGKGDGGGDDSQELETTEISPAHAGDPLEELVRQAIAEQDFSAAVETGMQEPVKPQSHADDAIADSAPEHQPEAAELFEEPGTAEQALADDSDPEQSTEAIRARALKQELRDEDALDEIPAEHLASLRKIATPLELSAARQRSWGRRIGALALILLLGTALAAQYLWRYRDTYSVDPRFRTAYEFVCNQYRAITMLPCELPQYSEIEAIRSDNLAVRSHPQREDGLMVSVELRNTASFPQRFPILILGFNSASNEVIALREFAPEEYLDPGLRQFELMPPAAPVQVSLPIMDPGEDAINYTLAFRAR